MPSPIAVMLEERFRAAEADPDALLILSNALDPARENTRTGQIMGRLNNIVDIPIFGEKIHGPNSTCHHDAAAVSQCREALAQYLPIVHAKKRDDKLVVVGQESAKAVSVFLTYRFTDVPTIPHQSEWIRTANRLKVWETLAPRVQDFPTFDRFVEILQEAHTTPATREASRQTIAWVKHLPASDAQKEAASITGKRTIELIKHLPASDAQKAAASITGTRTIEYIKHLPATENTKRAAAENARCENSRKAAKITGDTIGRFNLEEAKLKPGFRDQWRLATEQVSSETLRTVVAKLGEDEHDLLLVAHHLCKQRGHLLEKFHKAVADKTVTQDEIELLIKTDSDKGSRKADVVVEQARHLYDLGLTLWQVAWCNPKAVSADDVRAALGMTEAQKRAHEKDNPRAKRGMPSDAITAAIKALRHVTPLRAATIFTVCGKPVKDLVGYFA